MNIAHRRGMANYHVLFAFAMLHTSCIDATEPKTQPAPGAGGGKGDYIGTDDRVQIRSAHDPRAVVWAGAVAAITRRSGLNLRQDGTFTADAPTLGARQNLCAGERFAEEPTLAFCSAWLIAPDLVATAGHCLNAATCDDLAFVFDYDVAGASRNIARIPAASVYFCSEVVAHEADDERDFAVVRLDRLTTQRTPFSLDPQPPARGAKLGLLGYPSGVYAKADLGGELLNSSRERIEATLDSFRAHSGGVVLDLASGKAVGIQIRGGSSNYEQRGSCSVTAHVTEQAVRDGSAKPAIAQRLGPIAALGSSSPPQPTTSASQTCTNRCGDAANNSCACDLACRERGDCCLDFRAQCDATPTQPICVASGGACVSDGDCAELWCVCEGPRQVTETFISGPNRCVAGACRGDERTSCAAACAANDNMQPLRWSAECSLP